MLNMEDDSEKVCQQDFGCFTRPDFRASRSLTSADKRETVSCRIAGNWELLVAFDTEYIWQNPSN